MYSKQTVTSGFYMTEESPCPYLPARTERKIFTPLVGRNADARHHELNLLGFRRSQSIAYRPLCDGCNACESARIDARRFQLSRGFRRVLRRNRDLQTRILPPAASPEQYEMARRYLEHRHADEDDMQMTAHDYADMIEETAVRTETVEYRDADGALYACMLRDHLADGLSLVYSFYDPAHSKRSLGTYMILDHIAECRAVGLPYLYLGYFVAGCEKMAYKQRFKPLQLLVNGAWTDKMGADQMGDSK